MIALFRTEFVKAARRTRSVVIAALLIGLPTLIVIAINRPRQRANDDEGLFRLAQQSGVLVPAAVLSVMSGFLLVVMAGMFAGDSVAGDAAWGNLRYVLLRPVSRTRLLLAKAAVVGALTWICVVLAAVAALVAGVFAFGLHPLTVQAVASAGGAPAFHLATSALWLRVVMATGYVAFGFTALIAMGSFISTLTDAPTGAIGATVGVYIVSQILNSITQLGSIRYAFPTHYLDSWQPMFTENRFPKDMAVGLAVQVVYLVVFLTAAVMWFKRKDISS
jgi:ABC-2 type transport system permease protein